MLRYTIVVEQPDHEGDNYSAYCPDVPGCVATGQTEAQVIDEMVQALEFHLEGLAEDGLALPPRRSSAVEVAVRTPAGQTA